VVSIATGWHRMRSEGCKTHYTCVKNPLVKTLSNDVLPLSVQIVSVTVNTCADEVLTTSTISANDHLSLYLYPGKIEIRVFR
jgi:hypothetical protein